MKRFLLAVLIIFSVSCKSDDDNSQPTSDNFDRQEMLVNWADKIIIPVFEDLNLKLDGLVDAKDDFMVEVNQQNLDALRTAWLNAYKVWQYAEMFHIGKAEEINYRYMMNIYPTNVQDIEGNMQSGNYDLTHPNNNDAVGFPALDYLLFGIMLADTDVLTYYGTDAEAPKRRQYISDIIDQMKSLTQQVLDDWKGGFRDEFVSRSGNTATSSVNEQTNDFIYYYEKLFRAHKFGIPAGVFSNSPLPDRVETFYNRDVSKEVAQEAFQAVKDFFIGKFYNAAGQGSSYDDYLIFLDTIRDGENLSAIISDQFNMVDQKLGELNDNFYQQIVNDNAKMLQTYDEIQRAVVLLKVDMLQAMDIRVDFVDADGD